jgi:DNA-binding NtrC family response regulator
MAASARPRVVFVVDDETDVADSVSALLRAAGFQVKTFYDSSEILRSSLQEPVPDVVVTGFAMPKCDGAALSAWLLIHHPACRIIMITEHATEVPAHLSEQTPYFILLQKPVGPLRLLAAVEGKTELAKYRT